MSAFEQQHSAELTWGLCPQTPGIFRFRARMNRRAAHAAPSFRPLGQRSGRIPALPYPLPKYRKYKSEADVRRRPALKKTIAGSPPSEVQISQFRVRSLAGFEVIMAGRFWGDHRGKPQTERRRPVPARNGTRPLRRRTASRRQGSPHSPRMADFAALLKLLGDHQVEYIVIGGAAAIAHG